MESIIKFEDTSVETLKTNMSAILADITSKYDFPELSKNDMREKVWNGLFIILDENNSPKLMNECLAVIRILSREKTDLDILVTTERLRVLFGLAQITQIEDPWTSSKDEIAVESLKCLCNIMFNYPKAVEMVSTQSSLQLMLNLLILETPKISFDMHFFLMKLLFVLSALYAKNRLTLYEECNGLNILMSFLKKVSKSDPTEKDVNLICETLKTVFNLFLYQTKEIADPKDENNIKSLVIILREILLNPSYSVDSTPQVYSNIINLITMLPRNTLIALVLPELDLQTDIDVGHPCMEAVDEIVGFLDSQLDLVELSRKNAQDHLSPVLVALINMSKSHKLLRKYLRNTVLPHLTDVHTRPEEGKTLRNKLCRLLTSPITSVSDLVADWLFILCKESVGRMVKYTGYGNAAGLFARRGLMGDSIAYSSDSESSDTEEYSKYKHEINPVLGCRTSPHPHPLEGMTDEQKEVLAMELINSIDRLQRNGCIQPCVVDAQGRPSPVEHVLQLQQDYLRRPDQ